MDLKDPSPFRLWVQRLWYQNCEEHLIFGEQPYKMKDYWNQYKWWIKREFKHQQSREHIDQ
jgi:hypothetical protein